MAISTRLAHRLVLSLVGQSRAHISAMPTPPCIYSVGKSRANTAWHLPSSFHGNGRSPDCITFAVRFPLVDVMFSVFRMLIQKSPLSMPQYPKYPCRCRASRLRAHVLSMSLYPKRNPSPRSLLSQFSSHDPVVSPFPQRHDEQHLTSSGPPRWNFRLF